MKQCALCARVLLSLTLSGLTACDQKAAPSPHGNPAASISADSASQAADIEFTNRRPALEFKGVRFGATLAEAKKILGAEAFGSCSVSKRVGGSCTVFTTFAGTSPHLISISFEEDGVGMAEVSMLIDPKDYAAIKEALAGKYGPPDTREADQLQNQFGLQFAQERCRWFLPGSGRISIGRFTDDATRGYVDMVSAAGLAAKEKRIRRLPTPKGDI